MFEIYKQIGFSWWAVLASFYLILSLIFSNEAGKHWLVDSFLFFSPAPTVYLLFWLKPWLLSLSYGYVYFIIFIIITFILAIHLWNRIFNTQHPANYWQSFPFKKIFKNI